jgi:hypothetical protein
MVSFIPLCFTLRIRTPGTYWVGSRAGLDVMEKKESPALVGIES